MLQYTVELKLSDGVCLKVETETQESFVTEPMIVLEALKILSSDPNLNLNINRVEKISVNFKVVGCDEELECKCGNMTRVAVSQLSSKDIDVIFGYFNIMLDDIHLASDLKANLNSLKNIYNNSDDIQKMSLEKDYGNLVERIKNI